MSRKRKPQTRSKPKAALTQRQRHRLNDIRPTVPHDYPNQGAEPLITTRAQGKRIRDAVRLAGVVQDLEAQVDGPATRRGPKRRLSVEALLVAMIIAAHDTAKSYHRTAVVLALIGLDAAIAYEMRVCTNRKWKDIFYKTTARRVKDLENVLQLGWFQDGEYRNFDWVSTRLLGASIPPTALQAIRAAALDETPRPMWARRTTVFENQAKLEHQAEASWRKENPGLPVPTDPVERIPMIEAEAIRQGWEVGPDGRLLHGKDPDARMGWATATSQLPSGYYVGYGLTLLVACPEVLWRGDPYKMELGEEVPLYILALAVNSAGSDPGPSGHQVFEAGRKNAPNLKDIVADRGYSTKRETLVRLLHESGINLTRDYKEIVLRRVKTINIGATKKSKQSVHIHCGTVLPQWITRYWEQPPARLQRPDKKDDLAQWYALRAKLLRWADRGFFKTKTGEITGDKRFQCPACADFCDDPTAPRSYSHPQIAKPDTTHAITPNCSRCWADISNAGATITGTPNPNIDHYFTDRLLAPHKASSETGGHRPPASPRPGTAPRGPDAPRTAQTTGITYLSNRPVTSRCSHRRDDPPPPRGGSTRPDGRKALGHAWCSRIGRAWCGENGATMPKIVKGSHHVIPELSPQEDPVL